MLVGKALLGLSSIMLCLLLLAVGSASAENFSRVDLPPTTVNDQQTDNAKDIEAHQYKGYLRLFVSEPVSRYSNDLGRTPPPRRARDSSRHRDHPEQPDTLKGDLVYNDVGMNSSNIEVIGAVYEYAGHTNYSKPPSGYPFIAHWVDAAAVATPGNPGVDDATLPYTHTVFVEFATRYS